MRSYLIIAGTITAAVVLGFGVRDAVLRTMEDYRTIRPAEARLVYMHSVVPGGVYDEADLVRATNDPVVNKHYADLGPMVRMNGLGGDYYDSYRIKNHIYWTSYRVHVASSERPWHETRGYGMIRPRCGNRLSLTPMRPTLAAGLEPGPDQLNDILPTETMTPVDSVIIPYTPENQLTFGAVPPIAEGSGFFVPPTVPGGAIVERRQLDAVVVPEPGSVWLVLSGIGVLLVSVVVMVAAGGKR